MFDRQRIREDLLKLDIREGAKLIVHSSYKAIGEITGGPQTFLDVLLDVIGDSGAVMVPVFNDPAIIFDLKETPSKCGIITELFRKMQGTFRSFHPTHSVAVRGFSALNMVNKHESSTALGINSPMHCFIDTGADILLVGVNYNAASAIHIAERIAKAPYIQIPCNDKYAHPVKALRNNTVEEYVIDECPGCSRNFVVVGEQLKISELVRTGNIGNAVSQKVSGKDMLECAINILQKDALNLLCNNPKCCFCPRARQTARERIDDVK